MKVLFIGGTGNISTSASKLCIEKGIDLYHLNRNMRKSEVTGVKLLKADISKSDELVAVLNDHLWDAVVNWIAFTPIDIERDFNLFYGKTKQYIFISSASIYQKPPIHSIITESTPLCNPFWEYSRNKIDCEDKLNRLYRETGYPITIVRPSHTYRTIIPLSVPGRAEYTIIDRMKKGRKIIVHGDGTSLWTLTHADDFAKGFVGLIGNRQALGHAFHITSDELLTWDQIMDTIADAIGAEPNIIHIPSDYLSTLDDNIKGNLLGDKAYNAIFDNSKIKNFVPGFSASIKFSEGIKQTIEWFESDASRMVVREDVNELIDKIIFKYEKIF